MNEHLMNIWIIVVVIVVINLLIFLTKSDNKLWKIPILIWGLIFSTIFIITPIQNRKVNSLDNQYWESVEDKSCGDREVWEELKNSRKQSVKVRMTLLYFLGIQTIMTFILQIIGYKKTEKKKLYERTSIIFGLLTLLFLVFQVMVEIVPTGLFF